MGMGRVEGEKKRMCDNNTMQRRSGDFAFGDLRWGWRTSGGFTSATATLKRGELTSES
jgi:hypothetical protein